MTDLHPFPPARSGPRSRVFRFRPCRLFSARRRLRDERGFTIVELLVVMIVIGILAAIAYAVFIGQRTKANDAKAKDSAAALAVDVQSCFTEHDDYTQCDTQAEVDDASLPWDTSVTAGNDCSQDPAAAFSGKPDNETVAVLAAGTDCYIIASRSREGGLYWIVKQAGEVATRGCVPPGEGGCAVSSDPAVGSWNK